LRQRNFDWQSALGLNAEKAVAVDAPDTPRPPNGRVIVLMAWQSSPVAFDLVEHKENSGWPT
jgi:hypothetical protein